MKYCSCIALALSVALSACATTHAPLATVQAPITGSINIGASKPELVPVVRTISIPCDPPAQFLSPYPALPPITGERMSEKQIIELLASDDAAYDDLRADHNGLAAWVVTHCQGSK